MPDDETGRELRFLMISCGQSLETRRQLFENAPSFMEDTGWYPFVTGSGPDGCSSPLRHYVDTQLRMGMKRQAIERLHGIGRLEKIENL